MFSAPRRSLLGGSHDWSFTPQVTESCAPPSELGGGESCEIPRLSAESSSHRASSAETMRNFKGQCQGVGTRFRSNRCLDIPSWTENDSRPGVFSLSDFRRTFNLLECRFPLRCERRSSSLAGREFSGSQAKNRSPARAPQDPPRLPGESSQVRRPRTAVPLAPPRSSPLVG